MAEENAAGISSFKLQLVVPLWKTEDAVQFYRAAFGAEELGRVYFSKRNAVQEVSALLCVELKIGELSFFVCDSIDDEEAGQAENNLDGGIMFRLETDDMDGVTRQAIKSGATPVGGMVESSRQCETAAMPAI